MKLYYTIKSAPEDIQTKPQLSLGGFKSSTPIQNSSVGNLFGDISMYTVRNGNQNQYIGLILKNETDKKLENTKLWFIFRDGCYSNLRVSIMNLSSKDGQQFMEEIPTFNSKPLYAEFFEASGEENAVSFGEMQIEEMIGVWIERELSIEQIKGEQNNIYKRTQADPYRFEEIVLDKEDSIELHISYDEVI